MSRTSPQPSSTSTSTRSRVGARALLSAALGVLLGAVVALLGVAAPAAAHGGDVVISLGTDGEGGISANLTWKLDGHPVEEAADVSVTAESADGETVGPLTLSSASEGVGWYTSEPGVLAEGNWTLTATITHPSEATASAQVDVVPLPEPAPDADDEAAAGAEDGSGDEADEAAGDPDAAADGSSTADDESTGSSAGVWIAVAVVAALLLAGGYVVLRRRSRAAAADESSDGKPRSLTSTSAR
ncbi:LPXTG cell wall anchor domain-containing protein [Cellulosimicrobium cellulans]|uniref:LPXTG cell wall anchor domain-containing protein n=1 Tax=Cellulosimicrobium cellulans TaxID=1710 RepID=A0A4Y4E2X8_CELCE|nr:LPXTG cell wall anchor domain-containing protein [Cellulosimicrobium cellulans]GED11736.1 hypothetical protein CCE02nite_37350 [Cellulosimicrobium cellulans]